MKNELCYIKQHLWRYEYDYNCNRYSLVTTTKGFAFLNFMHQAISARVYTVRKLKHHVCGLT